MKKNRIIKKREKVLEVTKMEKEENIDNENSNEKGITTGYRKIETKIRF